MYVCVLLYEHVETQGKDFDSNAGPGRFWNDNPFHIGSPSRVLTHQVKFIGNHPSKKSTPEVSMENNPEPTGFKVCRLLKSF